MRHKALATLIERRGHAPDSADYQWRTRAAWKYLQMSMGRSTREWTDTPPPVTVSMPKPQPQGIAA